LRVQRAGLVTGALQEAPPGQQDRKFFAGAWWSN